MSTESPRRDDPGLLLRPTRTDEVAGLTAADVMHAEVESLPAVVTAAELRDWFAISKSRRLAVLAVDGMYCASFTPTDVPPGAPADQGALEFARDHPTVSPETPAAVARDVVFATDARRVPVVDATGRLHGVLAVTTDLQHFACRPKPAGADYQRQPAE